MAAIRTRRIHFTTSVKAVRGEIAQRTAKRKMKRRRGPKKLRHHEKFYYEVVATTEEEANSGLFTQIGELYVLKPAEREAFLWNRVVLMSEPEHREVWSAKNVGVRIAMNILGVKIPDYAFSNPSALLSFTVTGKDGNLHKPYEELLKNRWLPNFVYRGGKLGAEGLFKSKTAAYDVAGLFGITVYKGASAKDWYRAPVPDIQADVMRSVQYDEDAYQHLKQTLLSHAEVRAQLGHAPEMDWEPIRGVVSRDFGPRTDEVMLRLKADLAMDLHRLIHLSRTKPRRHSEGEEE